jgi:predicted component of type VI protein secretion system
VGAGLAALTSILNPSSILGRGVANTVGQSLPQLFTPNVAGVLQSSSLATTIANTFGGGNVNGTLQTVASTMGTSESQVVANMGPGVRDMYNQLLKDDPKQARAFLIQEMMASLKLMGEILSNVSKTRSEISMTFARNARA